ncbi:serine hydrolase domain-containing protein [Kitasatospora sp. NPDC054939]
MSDLGSLGRLAQSTTDALAGQQVGVVVAAMADDTVEIRGAGRTGASPDATPGGDGAPGADTLFEIGSVTKVFTALALARLTLAGPTELDEPLADLVADAMPPGSSVPAKGGEAITLKHLATHTAGLPRLPKGMLLPALITPHKPDPYADCTTDKLLAGLGSTRLRARPGHSFRYSNLGAGLLGLALARREGTTFEELVAREICRPLGLDDTVITVGEEQAGRLARGHSARRRPVAPWHLADLAGAGALRSTAADLAVFMRAQLAGGGDGPLAAAIDLSREVKHRVNPFAWVHLGWLGHRLHPRQGGHLQIWHNGGTGGFASFMAFDPEKQVGVIALANTRRSPDQLAIRLLRTLQRDYATTA